MKSLGIVTVTTHGTPVQLSATSILCSKIWLQSYKAMGASGTDPTPNTKSVYLMRGNVAKATAGASLIMAVEVGGSALTPDSVPPYSYDLSSYYLDADADGDGALVCYA